MEKTTNIKLCPDRYQHVICENCSDKETLGSTRNYKPANGVLCYTVHQLYQHILYFMNATQFHGTHMNVMMLMQKVQTSFNSFS